MFGIPSIPVTHLEGVDLNLLPPLAALLEERHVTRAAERSSLSQPAMSRALARLRQLLDDQLLVRDGSGYVLTPRAERIQRQLAGLMPQLETLFAAEVFDPATAEEHYRLAATDYSLLLFLHQVAREVNTLSPNSVLRIESPRGAVFDDVLHGRLDLSFYVAAPPAAFSRELLFEDICVCVMSADNPLAKRKRLTLDQYVRCSHLVIDIIDGEQPLIANRLNTSCSGTRASIMTPPNSGCATRFAPLRQQLSAARGAGANPGASARTRWWLVERAACRGGAAGVAAGPTEHPGDADRDHGAGGGTGPVDPEVVEAV